MSSPRAAASAGPARRATPSTIGARLARHDPQPFQEAYRVVRSNLLIALADIESPRVVVTSANAGEGKSVVCANLAVSFARTGQRVAVVDLNLRHPAAHRLLGAENGFGVTDVLLGRRTIDDSIQYLPLPNPDPQSAKEFRFLGAGPPVPNPTELLGSAGTVEMLEQLGEQSDLILIDAPPLFPGADMLVIGPVASGVVLVVEARRTNFSDLTESQDLLARTHTRLFGVVLNKLKGGPAGSRRWRRRAS